VVPPILVVSDLTHASDEALRAAGRLAARCGAVLHVVHCAGLVGKQLREVLPLLQTASPALLSQRLEEQVRRVVPERHEVRTVCHVEYRAVPEGALGTVRAVHAQQVVVGLDAIGSGAMSSSCPVPAARPQAAADAQAMRGFVEEHESTISAPAGAGAEQEPVPA
jgi:hypothetical protein